MDGNDASARHGDHGRRGAASDDGKPVVAHVGDSRVYLWRDGELEQITQRSLVGRASRCAPGVLTERDARQHPWRNVVTRALSGGEDPEVDVTAVDVEPGDRLLLCSDGLSGVVADERIERSSGQRDAARGDLPGADRRGERGRRPRQHHGRSCCRSMWHNLAQLLRYRGLIQSLVARELKARYRGSVLGFFWSFINPLLLLLIYSFVFTVHHAEHGPKEIEPYALFMFCGILPWTWFCVVADRGGRRR